MSDRLAIAFLAGMTSGAVLVLIVAYPAGSATTAEKD